jgi:hypothetical protein
MHTAASFIGTVRVRAAHKRSTLFRRHIEALGRPLRVIDLGGSAQMWARWGITEADGVHVVLANNHRSDTTHRSEPLPGRFMDTWSVDVLELPPDTFAGYDLVFSNSMLEHLPTPAAQARLAAAIMASGKPYFIQVPNKHCIVDPHFPHPLAAFFALWPRRLQAWAHVHHALGSSGRAGSLAAARATMAAYHPLARRELAALFPNGRVVTERNLGLPMSLVAMR